MGKGHRQFPVLDAGAEFLAMGYLMRRNILTFVAPGGNKGFDLICTNPNRQYKGRGKEFVKIQVKSKPRCDHGYNIALNPDTIKCFDFLVVVFQKIGCYDKALKDCCPKCSRKLPKEYPASRRCKCIDDCRKGCDVNHKVDLYVFSSEFIRQHKDKLMSRNRFCFGPKKFTKMMKISQDSNDRGKTLEDFRLDLGIEQIAKRLKVYKLSVRKP